MGSCPETASAVWGKRDNSIHDSNTSGLKGLCTAMLPTGLYLIFAWVGSAPQNDTLFWIGVNVGLSLVIYNVYLRACCSPHPCMISLWILNYHTQCLTSVCRWPAPGPHPKTALGLMLCVNSISAIFTPGLLFDTYTTCVWNTICTWKPDTLWFLFSWNIAIIWSSLGFLRVE